MLCTWTLHTQKIAMIKMISISIFQIYKIKIDQWLPRAGVKKKLSMGGQINGGMKM